MNTFWRIALAYFLFSRPQLRYYMPFLNTIICIAVIRSTWWRVRSWGTRCRWVSTVRSQPSCSGPARGGRTRACCSCRGSTLTKTKVGHCRAKACVEHGGGKRCRANVVDMGLVERLQLSYACSGGFCWKRSSASFVRRFTVHHATGTPGQSRAGRPPCACF